MPPKVIKAKKEDGRLAATVKKDVRKVNSRRRKPSSSDSSSGSDSDSGSHSSDCSTCSSGSHSIDCSTCSHSTDCSTCSDTYSPVSRSRPIQRKPRACLPCAKSAPKTSTAKKPAAKGKENECKGTGVKKRKPMATSTPKKAPGKSTSVKKETCKSKSKTVPVATSACRLSSR